MPPGVNKTEAKQNLFFFPFSQKHIIGISILLLLLLLLVLSQHLLVYKLFKMHRNLFLFLSLFLSIATTVSAFSSLVDARWSKTPRTLLSVSTTTHFLLDHPECLLEAEYCVPTEQQQAKKLSLAQQPQQVTWMELPRHSDGTESLAFDLELHVGRAAMVVAVLLVVTENMTGQSFALLGH
jgi:hypothetical protein